ncbi:uncharacterized protein BX663DRAFT_414881, partial [Cokeromyces recurvatus]|uniref:uncharacterized protein n=1 Tax=Cokeromyces recurvatus TaxID=90255 RepID=UPI002220328C
LGWLPGSKLQHCVFHSNSRLNWDHATIYFDMHSHFQMPHTIPVPLSFVLNRLPSK